MKLKNILLYTTACLFLYNTSSFSSDEVTPLKDVDVLIGKMEKRLQSLRLQKQTIDQILESTPYNRQTPLRTIHTEIQAQEPKPEFWSELEDVIKSYTSDSVSHETVLDKTLGQIADEKLTNIKATRAFIEEQIKKKEETTAKTELTAASVAEEEMEDIAEPKAASPAPILTEELFASRLFEDKEIAELLGRRLNKDNYAQFKAAQKRLYQNSGYNTDHILRDKRLPGIFAAAGVDYKTSNTWCDPKKYVIGELLHSLRALGEGDLNGALDALGYDVWNLLNTLERNQKDGNKAYDTFCSEREGQRAGGHIAGYAGERIGGFIGRGFR